jgi:hypothetical protein
MAKKKTAKAKKPLKKKTKAAPKTPEAKPVEAAAPAA